MTAPQFPAAWGQPPAPQAPPPPAAPGYQPQQYAPPQQFAQPAAPMAPSQQYPPAAPGMYAPQFPGQPYGMPMGQPPAYDPYAAQQMAPQPPAFTPAGGTLDEYLGQKAAGAQYWKFPQPSAVNIGMVKRDLRDSDVHQVTFKGQPVRRADGSVSQEKVIDLPMVNTDGTEAIMEIKGHQRKALEDAVSAGSGGKRRLPEGGSMIRATFTHTEPSNGGGSPKKIIRWEYVPADQVQGGVHSPAEQAGYAAMQQGTQQPAAPQQYQNPAAYVAPNPGQVPPPVQPDLQYASPVPGPQQYAQPAMQAPPAQQFPAQGSAMPGVPAQGGAMPQQATAPAPQPYQAPGMDPQAQQLFGNLIGGAAPGQPAPQ